MGTCAEGWTGHLRGSGRGVPGCSGCRDSRRNLRGSDCRRVTCRLAGG